jgi:peptidoglycan hydrolase-like protein with peptidoglycan-binding domain
MSETVSRGRDASRQADTRAAAGMSAPAGPEPGRGRRRRRRRVLAGGAAAAVAAAGVTIAVTGPFAGAGHAGGGPAAGGYPTSVSAIARRLLQAQTNVPATLGYAGSYTVAGHGGTLTWLPAPGRVIGQGQVLYRVGNGTPVFLLYGRVPAWRALAAGVHGADVRQLNRALVALGCATRAQLDPASKYFTAATAYAVEKLQARLGLPQTGTLPLGQAVFLPSAIRVTTVPGALGAPAAGPVLAATSARHVVTIALDAAQQSQVKAGDKVAITLPAGRVTPGVVASVGKVATGGSSPKVTVTVTLDHPRAADGLDQAPVTVSITTASVRNALVVPVDALLARPAGYAVEEVSPGGRHRLVPVTLGLFDDAAGLVQVSGAGLAAGQTIVVPAS